MYYAMYYVTWSDTINVANCFSYVVEQTSFRTNIAFLSTLNSFKSITYQTMARPEGMFGYWGGSCILGKALTTSVTHTHGFYYDYSIYFI